MNNKHGPQACFWAEKVTSIKNAQYHMLQLFGNKFWVIQTYYDIDGDAEKS